MILIQRLRFLALYFVFLYSSIFIQLFILFIFFFYFFFILLSINYFYAVFYSFISFIVIHFFPLFPWHFLHVICPFSYFFFIFFDTFFFKPSFSSLLFLVFSFLVLSTNKTPNKWYFSREKSNQKNNLPMSKNQKTCCLIRMYLFFSNSKLSKWEFTSSLE